ncbi:MAG: hypothetical protein ACF8NJ_05590 [Phycisphaerales bacterium JB038]
MRLLPLLASLSLLTGCVVVDEPETSPAPLPSGAVQPAIGADTSSIRVETALLPLGKVAYDGQVLPIVSPDGRYLAVQIGAAPTWGALLARDESLTPLSTRIAVYELGERGLTLRYESSAGLMLGRTATAGAVLVEQPNRDGSRWIGLMDWRSGALEWINQDERVNAFAHTNGERLAWSRRAPGSETWDLVIQQGTGRYTIEAEGGKWLQPVFSARGDLLYALYLDPNQRLHVVALRLSTLLNEHEIVAESIIAGSASEALAYQIFAAVQDPGGSSLAGAGLSATSNPGLLLFHPSHRRLGRFDPDRGSIQLFDPGTLGATWLNDREVVLTMADEVRLRSLLAKESIGPVLRSTYIARSTPGHPMRVLLLGPGGGAEPGGVPTELTVVRLGLPRQSGS